MAQVRVLRELMAVLQYLCLWDTVGYKLKTNREIMLSASLPGAYYSLKLQ